MHDCGGLLESGHWTPTRSVREPPLWDGRNAPNDLAMNGARDTVLELQVHFRDGVFREDGGVGYITWIPTSTALVLTVVLSPPFHSGRRYTLGEARRTDGGALDHVADGESLYRLVLWCTPRAIGAADGLDVTSSLLVATAVVDVSVMGLGVPDLCGRRTWMLAS